MNPIIAIVGRPNAGKSTLFNRLTHSRDALVADRPGVTRDRQYGIVHHHNRHFLVIDTGGLGEEQHDSESIADLVEEQAMRAVEEADILLWLVDGRAGMSATDENLAGVFRKQNKPVYLLVNKLEGLDAHTAVSDFYRLGFEQPRPISARHGDGIGDLLDELAAATGEGSGQEQPDNRQNDSITISILGRPNAGKSTLINRILDEDRMLSSDEPGTTRDSIRVPFKKDGRQYVLIDTAGVRRRSKIDDPVEKFSVIKSFRAIDQANIVVLIIDGQQGVTEQDSRLLGIARESGKALIIAVNKWDGVPASHKKQVRSQLDRKCRFVDYAETHFISALKGSGIALLFKTIKRINHSLQKKYSSSDITGMLFQFTEAHPPPIIRGLRTKLRYAHLGENNPVKIIIHGNRTEHVSDNYLRYLARSFRQQMGLIGTPVLIEFKHRSRGWRG